MLEFLSLVVSASYGAAVLLAFLASVLVVVIIVAYVLRLRERRPRVSPARDPKDDITHTRIMFQTMRDILEQQKDVARQLNVSLDKKVQYIKRIVDTAIADLQQMRETARKLAVELTETKAELAELKAQKAQTAPSDAPIATGEDDAASVSAPTEEPAGTPHEPAHLEALERPVLEEPPDTEIHYWAGLDFGETLEEEEQAQETVTPPEEPENAEAARNAFRALLNLDASGGDADHSAKDANDGSGNGRSSSVPLKRRIYEYSDVGMSVSEIARELGLGKGEVRLILNLRKDRGE